MKLKRLVMLILVITILVPVTYYTNTKEVSAASTFRIKGYRHSHAALIEWTKVPSATNYKIYRATRKKGKKAKYTKFKELKIKKGENKLTESWFTKYGDNILNTRWFVNVDTDGFEKTQKKYLYNHNRTYKYKVKAFDNNKKCIAVSNTIKVKKYKSRMYEPRYENLYYVNKARFKYKLNVIPWGHQYNKGLKGRAKDMRLREKRREKFSKNWHKRPNGKSRDSLFQNLKVIDVENLAIYSPTKINENIAKNGEYANETIRGYLKSRGHRVVVLKEKMNCYCAYMVETQNSFYDVMSVLKNSLVISNNGGKTYNIPVSYYGSLKKNVQSINKSMINEDIKINGDILGNGKIGFHTSHFNKMKTLYPFITINIKEKYFNNTNNIIYTYDPYGYFIPENDSAAKNKEKSLLFNFLKDYVDVLPYK